VSRFFVPVIWQNHRPALLSCQLTQDQQACQGHEHLPTDSPTLTRAFFLNARRIVENIIPGIVDDMRHHPLDHQLVIGECFTELNENVLVGQ